jgi:hypothetical protein
MIIILYNLACTSQRQGLMDECVCYLDAAIYNMNMKIEQVEAKLAILNSQEVALGNYGAAQGGPTGASKRLF